MDGPGESSSRSGESALRSQINSSVIQDSNRRVWEVFESISARPVSLVVLVSFALIVPALTFGIPSNIDLTNHFRFALPFYDGIVSGNLYPGWLAESNSGYGDPSFRFYPPALYYLLAVTRFVIGNWYAATLLVCSVLSVVGGLGMYFWAKAILPAPRAMWASFFFALAPYHVNQLYQATLLAEWAGCAILPFVFGFVERVCENGRRRDVAGLAATYALLILTHLPLAVIGSFALLVYGLFRTDRSNKVRTLSKLGAGVALGLCASSVYWVTMFAEMRWIGINEGQRDPSVDYRVNFVLSTFSADNLNVWWMNILLLLTVLLFAPAVLLLGKQSSRQLVSRTVVVLTAFALFMSLPLSRPLWNALLPLQQTQFPWRWLSIVSMGGSILAAAGLPFLANSARTSDRTKRLLIIGAVTISIAFTLSHIVREAQYLTHPRFEDALTSVRGTPSVNYWVPVWAHSNPQLMTNNVEAQDRSVSVELWQPEHRQFSVAAGSTQEVRVRTFYYPHWTATSEGQVLPTRPDKDGAILISVPSKATSIALDFHEPMRSRVSGYVSFAGFVFVGALALPTVRKRNK